jgi:translocation and assembly module TamB
VLQDDVLQLQQLSFQTGRNGTLTAIGTVRLDGQQGVAVDLAVASRRALLVNRADLVATVSSDLKVTGSTGAGIDVAGPVTVDRAEISVGGAQSAAFPTVDVREINKPGASPAPPPSPARAAPPSPSATPIRLALNVQAPQAVFVRGRGLDAEMSGSLQVTGAPTAPAVIGGLTVRRGDFTLGGRRLVFSRGIVSLNNVDRIDPALDFIATTTVQSTTINVVISGTAAAPVIAISSVPALPQDEALALLLFGKPASGLSAFELIQVAQTLAELTGREAPGTGVLGRLRQSLGLDQLRVGTSSGSSSSSSSSSSSPVSVEAGRYVAPGVYVGAKQGATGNSSRGVVEIDVLDHTKLEGDIGADSNGRVGVKMQWDY